MGADVTGDLDPADVEAGAAAWTTMLWRGARKHCPRCDGRGLYGRWAQMADWCPRCGVRFEREPGFFLGAYLINFAITEGLLFVLIMGYVGLLAHNAEAGVAVPLALGLIAAVAGPVFFYPYSRTIWSAIDLAMRPLELDEIVAARSNLASGRPLTAAAPGPTGRRGGRGPGGADPSSATDDG